jgi:hypothetical protein
MDKKYQYSKFIGENREEQIVIRCDTWAEFTEAKKNIDSLINPQPVQEYRENRTTQAPNKPDVPQSVEQFDKVCNQCGGEKVLNPKTGKMFCKAKCWLK